jgi:hypothetical protein
MTTRKARVSRPVDGLVRHPGLYLAQLSCKIGRDVLEGKAAAPDGVQPIEWAMFNLLCAVEEIATAMMPNTMLSASGERKETNAHK